MRNLAGLERLDEILERRQSNIIVDFVNGIETPFFYPILSITPLLSKTLLPDLKNRLSDSVTMKLFGCDTFTVITTAIPLWYTERLAR